MKTTLWSLDSDMLVRVQVDGAERKTILPTRMCLMCFPNSEEEREEEEEGEDLVSRMLVMISFLGSVLRQTMLLDSSSCNSNSNVNHLYHRLEMMIGTGAEIGTTETEMMIGTVLQVAIATVIVIATVVGVLAEVTAAVDTNNRPIEI